MWWRPARRGAYRVAWTAAYPDEWPVERKDASWERFWLRVWPDTYCLGEFIASAANDRDHIRW